jgi:alpha-beta hydrolase superfamily lysophospholipase
MYVTGNEIKGIYKNLPAAKKKLVVYTGANHESFLQYDPIEWQKNVTSFLNASGI